MIRVKPTPSPSLKGREEEPNPNPSLKGRENGFKNKNARK